MIQGAIQQNKSTPQLIWHQPRVSPSSIHNFSVRLISIKSSLRTFDRLKMLRGVCKQGIAAMSHIQLSSPGTVRYFAGKAGRLHNINKAYIPRPGTGVSKEEMPFYHHRYGNYNDLRTIAKNEGTNDTGAPQKRIKHKIPRKRASKLMNDLHNEVVANNIESRPDVLQSKFCIGDAIEVEHVSYGGIKSDKTEKARGVVIGRVNKGLGASVLIRDVVYGEAVERQFPLHSPLIRSIKVLEKNFIYKGRRKVKRSKLYFLRDRPLKECQVTKW